MIFILIVLLVLFLPPILLICEGFFERKAKPNKAKIWFVLAVVYLIIGFGVCGSIIS